MSIGINWAFEEEELSIFGEGAMADYKEGEALPWEDVKEQVRVVCIERGVTSVGARAFAGMEALETVFLSDTVRRIGFGAFKGCKALQEVDTLREFSHRYEKSMSVDANRIVVGMQAFVGTPWCAETYGTFYMNKGVLVEYLGDATEVVIPEGVKEIGTMAFEGRGIEKVTFPASLRVIRSYAFMNTKLQELVLPETVEVVESCAFAYAAPLSKVVLENDEADLATDAFYGTMVGAEVAAAKKGIPSLFTLVPVAEPGLTGAKRISVQKDPKVHIGFTYFDASNALKKKIKAGTTILRVCYNGEKKTLDYVQAIYKTKQEKGLYETYLMYPYEAEGSAEIWRDSFTYWGTEDVDGLNTAWLDGDGLYEDLKYDWYQVSNKAQIDVLARTVANYWLKKHPEYRALSQEENREQDSLRMFVPD
ncbi:MAG: leucine-rich repeat domain-containing protein [Lachnospiraceae bacterium]|nr:leucine-rich repeat domain-containing protein [Lachnospiraceae bacterium]